VPFSDFNYVTVSGLSRYISVASGASEEYLARCISDAERIVDAYVAHWPGMYPEQGVSLAAPLLSGETTVQVSNMAGQLPNYWARGGHYLIVNDGDAVDQARLIVASNGSTLTLASGFTADVSADARLSTEQRSLFPRYCDQDVHGTPRLPEALARATAYQVEFGWEFGSAEEGLGAPGAIAPLAGVTSRTYASGYSESRNAEDSRGLAAYLSPKARNILQGLMNQTGYLP
jgi:hypothetical protein